MRVAIPVLGLVLGFAFWLSPSVEIALPARDVVTVRPIDQPGPWPPAATGADTLVFPVPPRRVTAPVMPDIPIPLPAAMPDRPPRAPVARAALPQPLAEATLLSARLSEPARHRVVALALKLRQGPSAGDRVLGTLRRGEVAEVTGAARRGWVPVRLPDSGRRGWVFARFLAPLRDRG